MVLQQIKSDYPAANGISNVLDSHSDFNLTWITHSKPKETSLLVKPKLTYQSGYGQEIQAFSVCVRAEPPACGNNYRNRRQKISGREETGAREKKTLFTLS